MTSAYTANNNLTTFDDLYAQIKSFPAPLLPPGKALDASLTDAIASLYLHPALEALLHILNFDLPSAHFLVRHMQSAPALEGMYIHGLLHRVEGDMNNARAWYGDVTDADCFTNVWGEASESPEGLHKNDKYWFDDQERKVPRQARARDFLTAVETLQKSGKGSKEQLEKQSREEVDTLMTWCVDKFGTRKWEDATKVWVQPSDDIKSKGQAMVSGGEGHRKF